MRAIRLAALIAVAAPATLVPAAAMAQSTGVPAEPNPSPDPNLTGDTLTVGVAAVNMPDYDGSNDYRWLPAPAAIGSFKGVAFQLLGNRLSVDLIPPVDGSTVDVQLGPIAVLNFNRSSTKNIDDPRVRALGKIDRSVELGGYVGVGKTGIITSPYDKLSASLSYRHDVSGVHNSGILTPSVNYLTPLSRKSAVTLFAAAEHAGRGFARTYYDVGPAGSLASGLPVYHARGGWKEVSLGLAGTYALTGDLLHGFKVVAGGTYRRLLNDFADSPIVSIAGSRNQWLGAVGLAYTF